MGNHESLYLSAHLAVQDVSKREEETVRLLVFLVRFQLVEGRFRPYIGAPQIPIAWSPRLGDLKKKNGKRKINALLHMLLHVQV